MSKKTIDLIARAIMDCEAAGPIRLSAATVVARAILESLREPTSEMKAAAYYAGGVGDCGGAERADFEIEWNAAIEQALSNKKPTGILKLVSPYYDDDAT